MIMKMSPMPSVGFHHITNSASYATLPLLYSGWGCTFAVPQSVTFPRLFLGMICAIKKQRESVVRNEPLRLQCSTIGSFATEWMRSRDYAEMEAGKHSKQPNNGCRIWAHLRIRELYTPVLPCVHRLEVEDPLHRYGAYLRAYYADWVALETAQPFFTWLDRGAGRLLNASRRRKAVSRAQLNNSRVQYCNLQERQQYEVIVRGGILVWANGLSWCQIGKHEAVHTVHTSERWIFVIDLHGKCYLNTKKKGRFHHSSFLSGAPVQMAGRMKVERGKIVEIGEYSGHYRSSVRHLTRAVEAFFGDAIESDDGAFT